MPSIIRGRVRSRWISERPIIGEELKNLLARVKRLLQEKSSKDDKLRGLELADEIVSRFNAEQAMDQSVLTQLDSSVMNSSMPPATTDVATMAEAARVMGAIAAKHQACMRADLVIMKIERAREWCSRSSDSTNKHGVMLLLSALSLAVPNLFAEVMLNEESEPQYLEFLFSMMQDARTAVRDHAVEAMSRMVCVLDQTLTIDKHFAVLLNKIKTLQSTSNESYQLAVVLFIELLAKNYRKLDLIRPYLLPVPELTIKLYDSRNTALQRAVMAMSAVLFTILKPSSSSSSSAAAATHSSALSSASASTPGTPTLGPSSRPSISTLSSTSPQSLGPGGSSPMIYRPAGDPSSADSPSSGDKQGLLTVAQNKSVKLALRLVVKEKDRLALYTAWSGLIKVLGEKMVLHDGARCMLLWDMLAETLTQGREGDPLTMAALDCVEKLVMHLGNCFVARIGPMIEACCNCWLGQSALRILDLMCRHPPVEKLVHTELISLICAVLEMPVAQDAHEATLRLRALQRLSSIEFSSLVVIPTERLVRALNSTLSLPTLDHRMLAAQCLLRVVAVLHHPSRGSGMPRSDSMANTAALQAVTASTQLQQTTQPSAQPIVDVPSIGRRHGYLITVLQTAVSDPEPSLRDTLLRELINTELLHPFVAQPDCVRIFLAAKKDPSPNVREVAHVMLGLLLAHNFNFVSPLLNNAVHHALRGLEVAPLASDLALLAGIARAAPSFVRLHAKAILLVVIPLLKREGFGPDVLALCGELAQSGSGELREYLAELVHEALALLTDYSRLGHRRIAVDCLIQLKLADDAAVRDSQLDLMILSALIKVLGVEYEEDLRQRYLTLLGMFGAPRFAHTLTDKASTEAESNPNFLDEFALHERTGRDDYFTIAALNGLLRIANDRSLASHYEDTQRALVVILQYANSECIDAQPRIIRSFIFMITQLADGNESIEVSVREMCNLLSLINCADKKLTEEAHSVMDAVKRLWPKHRALLIPLLDSLCIYFQRQMLPFAHEILCLLDEVMRADEDLSHETLKCIHILRNLVPCLQQWTHFYVQTVAHALSPRRSVHVRQETLELINFSCRHLDLSINGLTLVLAVLPCLHVEELRLHAVDTLAFIAAQLGQSYVAFGFAARVHPILYHYNVSATLYERVLMNLDDKKQLIKLCEDELTTTLGETDGPKSEDRNALSLVNLTVNSDSIRKAWDFNISGGESAYNDWFRRLCRLHLKESPVPALRACSLVAERYVPLARELFNAAFVSCWAELFDDTQEAIVDQMERILQDTSPYCREIKLAVLNLHHFMGFMNRGTLFVPEPKLTAAAVSVRAFAKALDMCEMNFSTLAKEVKDPSLESDAPALPEAQQPAAKLRDCIQQLIELNDALQQPDAARGIVEYSSRTGLTTVAGGAAEAVPPKWLELLGDWQGALKSYREQATAEARTGELRCLSMLGRFAEIHTRLQETLRLPSLADVARLELCKIGCHAALCQQDWGALRNYLIPKSGDVEMLTAEAISALQSRRLGDATALVDEAFSVLDTPLSFAISESISRASMQLFQAELLVEVQEIISFLSHPDPVQQDMYRRTWHNRLLSTTHSRRVWQPLLALRSLVTPPALMKDLLLRFSSMCLGENLLDESRKWLRELSHVELDALTSFSGCQDLNVVYAYIKHLFFENKDAALTKLRSLLGEVRFGQASNSPQHDELLARIYCKLGLWMELANDGQVNFAQVDEIATYYDNATRCCPEFQKGWHRLAYLNFKVLSVLEAQNAPEEKLHAHAKLAVQGFFKSIGLNSANTIQDALRLVKLWFSYGHLKGVNEQIHAGLKSIAVEAWLDLIPQFVANIDCAKPVRETVVQVLTSIGRAHPQAVLLPLLVSSQSAVRSRAECAHDLLNTLRPSCPRLLEQTEQMCHELIRSSSLWAEQWHATLQEASCFYFDDSNIPATKQVLLQLHEKMQSPETPNECAFLASYKLQLDEARGWLQQHDTSGRREDLNAAWAGYYSLFRRLSRALPLMTVCNLNNIAPRLLALRDLQVAVPGSYRPGQPVVSVKSFSHEMTVIASKQRPRRLSLLGSDGRTYSYLLKGNEDPRMDERAMAFFGLVNQLLAGAEETAVQHLAIIRYSITPLSPKCGLIGWVAGCDTLHALVKAHRLEHKVTLYLEDNAKKKMAPDVKDAAGRTTDRGYDNLSLIHKVEIFRHAQSVSQGDDLALLMRRKCPDTQTWFNVRINYTTSLAVMSMVGYLLGLGDRHPSNLMMQRGTGRIVHIDFGDCFEVAQQREKYPERVPFRLTRMLVRAMEVSGIEGTFRLTSERVMKVLRTNKDSLLAIFDALAHDPLLLWGPRELDAKDADLEANKSNDIIGLPVEIAAVEESPDEGTAATRRTTTRRTRKDNAPAADKARRIIQRVEDKLAGRDCYPDHPAAVPAQVEWLINAATSDENLCQAYSGWCPFW